VTEVPKQTPQAVPEPLPTPEPVAAAKPPASIPPPEGVNGNGKLNGNGNGSENGNGNGKVNGDGQQPAANPAPAPQEQAPAAAIPVRTVAPPVTQIYPPPVQADDIQIVPGLPDRSSNKIFRLQVGAYSAQDSADRASQRIKGAGFEVEQELAGSIYRVLVTGIAASDVYPASVRLGSLGFGQIWVRE
jgi:hypothetical protein